MASYLGGMALFAPSLAFARLTRAIKGGRIEQGFAAWFMAVPAASHCEEPDQGALTTFHNG